MDLSRYFDDKQACLTLYQSLVQCCLRYATVIWKRDCVYTVAAIQTKFFSRMVWKFPELNKVKMCIELNLSILLVCHVVTDLLFFKRVLHGDTGSIEAIGLSFKRAVAFTLVYMIKSGVVALQIGLMT